MNEGVWNGPTLLLAPAQGLVAQQSGVDAHTLPRELKSPVHIIHGTGLFSFEKFPYNPADTTVIYMHSTKLAASTKCHERVTFQLVKGKWICEFCLTSTGDDHKLSKTLTGPESMKKAVLELVNDIHTTSG